MRRLAALGLAGCGALIAAAVWYLQSDPPATAELRTAARPPEINSPSVAASEIPPAFSPPKIPAPAAPNLASGSPPAEPETPLGQLERRFHTSGAKEDRIEIAAEIAGRGDENAVAALSRLFQAERHPAVKVALLADLNDISHDTAPEQRLRILTAALRGQPRDVRTTALDSLAQLDDPQVTALLTQAMKSDPDREVREVAAALLEALSRN